MKKMKWLYWLVAIMIVTATGFSIAYVHQANQQNAAKMAKQAKLDAKMDKKIAKLKTDQKNRAHQPIDWEKPSLLGEYPDLTPYYNVKKEKDKIWLDVSVRKQRVYVMQGRYRLYTMYASVGKNYPSVKNFQRTPTGTFKIQKQKGKSYYDATKGYGAKYWTSFSDQGFYRFESVPFDADDQVLTKQAKRLGNRKVSEKHNVKNYGSIRLTVSDAKWLQENIKPKTRVVIHGIESDDDYLDFLY